MNKFCAAALGLAALFALSSTPADANGRRSIKDDVSTPPFRWTGFYAGLHLGGARGETDWTFFDGAGTSEAFNQSSSSVIGGGQAGWLSQWGNLVAGVEVSYSALDLSKTTEAALVLDRTRTSEINDLFLATVRLGFAADRWLAYAKGGYANAEVDFVSNVASSGAQTSSSSERENGWVLGAGVEYALTQAVSFGVEYTFVHLNIDDRTQTNNPGFCPAPCAVTGPEADIHSITARLNLKFW
jgi:outer membrane immunogenic protein